MKYYFLLLPFLLHTGIFAGDKEKQLDQIDIKHALLTTLIVLSVHEQAIIKDTEPTHNEPDNYSQKNPTKSRYKPQPKKQNYNRRKQTNNRIQQYRRR